MAMNLSICYDSETDILSLWNGRPADEGADIAENLNAEGDVVGFTLEHAAELLESVTATGARGASHCNGLAGYLETSEEHRHKEECLMTLAEEHRAVSHQFIQQADEELERGDYLQASEKAWGAAVRAVKCIAGQRGWEHDSHRHLFAATRRIADEGQDLEIRELFGVASSLHINFYEGWMDDATVVGNIDSVKRLLSKLESLEDVST
jgi:uncharacterized protein YuzE